ncbi:phage portal protein [Paenibacillus glacialis]|uniref:Phage portal protein n=1 Tax=Paenibacillus glacialis TaxID=494026 RepID=A0A168DIF4_9BACL|nr:phage portal protein [Paenibacillus glacialis]
MDWRNRRLELTDSGHPRKTQTYGEYLVQTAMKILNTERFQYVVYGEDIGVEKSEWPGWEDIEIKRDIEEALTAHTEIEQAEVLSMQRVGRDMYLQISLTGLVGTALLEEEIRL